MTGWFAMGALLVVVLCGCAAPVRLEAFPGAGVRATGEAGCRANFDRVAVLGSLPPQGTFEEIGYMNLSQESTSEFVSVSSEAQIKSARIQACQWGADAIVVMGSDADQSTSWNFFSGVQSKKSKETRAIAIRYIETSDPAPSTHPAPAASGLTHSTSQTRTETSEYPIDLYLERPGTVVVELGPKGGEVQRMLTLEAAPSGTCSIIWDGRDEDGHVVSSGAYRYVASQNGEEIASGWILVR